MFYSYAASAVCEHVRNYNYDRQVASRRGTLTGQ